MKDVPLSEDHGRPVRQAATFEIRSGITHRLNTVSKLFETGQLQKPYVASQESQFDVPLYWVCPTFA